MDEGDHCQRRSRPGLLIVTHKRGGNRLFLSARVSLSQSTSEAHPVMHNMGNLEAARAKWKAIIVITPILFLRRDLPKRRC